MFIILALEGLYLLLRCTILLYWLYLERGRAEGRQREAKAEEGKLTEVLEWEWVGVGRGGGLIPHLLPM